MFIIIFVVMGMFMLYALSLESEVDHQKDMCKGLCEDKYGYYLGFDRENVVCECSDELGDKKYIRLTEDMIKNGK